MFIYSISSDWKNPKLESKLHSAVVGISLVIFFINFGIYGFIVAYLGIKVGANKEFWIILFIIMMIINGIYANSKSHEFVRKFNKEKNKKQKVMIVGGFISIWSFLFSFSASMAVRIMRHIG
jgi:accessory gene regulator protein AgrB